MPFLSLFQRLLVLSMLMSLGLPQCVIAANNIDERCLILVEAIQNSQGLESKKKQERQQTSFGAEQVVQHPTPIPSTVLVILQADARNQTCLQSGESQKAIPASWFVASHIWLQNNGDPDLIVVPNNACLNGANLLPFWILRRRGRGYALVLRADGLVLDILNTRTRKYRDIRLTSLSANMKYISLYKFNGSVYEKSRAFTKPLQ